LTKERVTRGTGLLEGFLAKKRIKMANSLIPNSCRQGSILDIGCGAYPLFLLKTEFRQKVGIDKGIDVSYLEERGVLNDSFQIQQYDFGEQGRLPFATETFDTITMLAVFEHVEINRIGGLVTDIYRTLKRGGYFVLTTPSGWTDKILRILAKMKLISSEEISDHKQTYSQEKISKILQQAGFDLQAMRMGYFELFMNIWAAIPK
jgi:SAM-dependent methyltransferase